MRRLDGYIVRAILGPVAMVIVVVMVLSGLFLFINQQDDIGVGSYTAWDAIKYVLLNLPEQAWALLPVATLIGSLLGLGSLARGSEITVIRATGISTWRIAGSALMAAAILIVLEVALGEFIAPHLQLAAKQNKAFSKLTEVTFGSGSGAWVKDGNLIISAARQSGELQFGGMMVFELSPDHRLRAIGHADRATAGQSDGWMLGGYSESRFTPDRVLTRPLGQRMLQSRVSAEFLGLAVSNPSELELASLFRLISYYKSNSLDAGPYVFAFWSRIARTVGIAFAVLLAVPFVLGSLRSAGAGARTMVGMGLGIAFFLLQQLIESGTFVFDLNPAVLAWIPTALLAALSLTLLARAK
ncbi:MAG: LPS export ABC transporter permease LptG [Gammaproteobacteria bacterium]